MLSLTPNMTVLRVNLLGIDPTLTDFLSYAPLLRHVEVETVHCSVRESAAPGTLLALRSLPQSITWRPFTLCLHWPQSQNTVLELCAAFTSTPLAQAVSKLTFAWEVEPPIAALRASIPNVLHFELYVCNQFTAAASPLCEAIAAWPMLRTIILTTSNIRKAQESQQHLEAAARTAAELKAGQPFEVVLQVFYVGEGSAARMDVLVAAIHNAGGAKVDVRWMRG